MVSISIPTIEDWSFAEIERSNSTRASHLATARGPSELLSALEAELRNALGQQRTRFGVDCKDGNPRAIIQFPVALRIYDWFFSARTGYRAQFWAGADTGDKYNQDVMVALRSTVKNLPIEIEARKIDVRFIGGSREEFDVGATTIRREMVAQSFDPPVAKIWICERLFRTDEGTLPYVPPSLINDPPRLVIPQWGRAAHRKTGSKGEGLRAPYPEDSTYCWLDLKGGFVGPGGVYAPPDKTPEMRAADLFACGWT